MSRTEMEQAAVSLFFFLSGLPATLLSMSRKVVSVRNVCNMLPYILVNGAFGRSRFHTTSKNPAARSGPPWRITTRAVSRRKTTNTRADWYRVVFRDANRLLWITRNAVARNLLTKRLAVTLLARYGGRFRSTKYILNVERGSFDFISYPFDNLSLSDSIIEKI